VRRRKRGQATLNRDLLPVLCAARKEAKLECLK